MVVTFSADLCYLKLVFSYDFMTVHSESTQHLLGINVRSNFSWNALNAIGHSSGQWPFFSHFANAGIDELPGSVELQTDYTES